MYKRLMSNKIDLSIAFGISWGCKEGEDDSYFAYRCMMQAHKMMKPSQFKRFGRKRRFYQQSQN